MRREGAPPLSGVRYRHRPGAYAILPLRGQVLLTHQAEPEPEFQLPGGGIEPGEGPVAALHREVYEETGWTISAPRRLSSYRRFVFMPEYDFWAEKIIHIFVARPALRRGAPPEPFHSAHLLPARDAIQRLSIPMDRTLLARVSAGIR